MPARLTIIGVAEFLADPATGVCIGQIFELSKDRTVFGRHPDNDIPLYSHDRLREHGAILRAGDSYFIEKNPTNINHAIQVNGNFIEGRTRLNDGDVITVWRHTKLQFQVDNRPPAT